MKFAKLSKPFNPVSKADGPKSGKRCGCTGSKPGSEGGTYGHGLSVVVCGSREVEVDVNGFSMASACAVGHGFQ